MDAKPKCPKCGVRMKPLFQSFYCPLDCDRKPPAPEIDDDWSIDTAELWTGLTAPVCCGVTMAPMGGLAPGWHCWGCGKVAWGSQNP